jgi:four helix bundle protein
MYKSFKEMPVWKEAMEISKKVFVLTEALPRKEDYGLTSQLRSSASSVSANIAEDFGRHHSNDKVHFYFFSRGSAFETQSHLEYGVQVGYFDKTEVEKLSQKLDRVAESLNRLIMSFKLRDNSKPKPESRSKSGPQPNLES